MNYITVAYDVWIADRAKYVRLGSTADTQVTVLNPDGTIRVAFGGPLTPDPGDPCPSCENSPARVKLLEELYVGCLELLNHQPPAILHWPIWLRLTQTMGDLRRLESEEHEEG